MNFSFLTRSPIILICSTKHCLSPLLVSSKVSKPVFSTRVNQGYPRPDLAHNFFCGLTNIGNSRCSNNKFDMKLLKDIWFASNKFCSNFKFSFFLKKKQFPYGGNSSSKLIDRILQPRFTNFFFKEFRVSSR